MTKTKKPAVKTFRIDRSKWRCGGQGKYAIGREYAALLNPQGFQCCLGHTTEQEGFARCDLMGKSMPSYLSVKNNIDSLFSVIEYPNSARAFRRTSTFGYDAASINDHEDETIPQKEARLRELFKKNGCRIVFYGKSVPYPTNRKYRKSQPVPAVSF